MNPKNRKPTIRFKAFNDPWEQRELNDFVNRYDNLRVPIAATKRVSGPTPYYGANGIQDYVSGYTHDGEFVLVAEDGANDLNNYPVQYVQGKIWVNNHVHVLQAKENANNKFLKYAISKINIQPFLVGSSRAKLNAETMMRLLVNIPNSLYEQLLIGNFFASIDTIITLHQRKLDKLQNIKKACLEKMFPQNGESVPRIRFKGFTDSWEQRKLSSLCSLFTDGDWIESKDQSNFGIRLIQTGNIGITEFIEKIKSRKWISENTFNRLHCEAVIPGDILISRLPDPAGRACIVPNLKEKMITAVDCTIARVDAKFCASFLIQSLSTSNYFSFVNTCLAGGTRQRISRSNLSNYEVSIPSKKIEQKQIGQYFKLLDSLITLHQRKLDKLKNLKKACLEKMFV